ncbi:MAG TPA: methyltransferase [Xanthomonadaceae bacterium]|jgi:predicted methyltransferase|nr:methyltransferase [Xanthomonadaceae bacterium]
MRRTLLSLALLAAAAALPLAAHTSGGKPAAAPAAAVPAVDPALAAAIAADTRTPANAARDRFRHPAETLTFFGITPAMTVVEVNPGSGAWWTEILAPWIKQGGGTYIAAIPDPAAATSERAREYFTGENAKLRERLAGQPAKFDAVTLREVSAAAPVYGAPGSADAVLTFRNLHGWIRNDIADEQMAAFFAVLTPGGVLGVEQHRASADVPREQINGYVSEAQVIALAEAAGFMLEARSEINANPKDDRDHPNGVWTLPPTLNVPAGEDKAVYEAIGESDRMTLRFRKPKA